MTTDIIKVVATLAISIVFSSCHNVRETVEEAAVHGNHGVSKFALIFYIECKLRDPMGPLPP